jgi:ankyrin repeat protein
MAFYDDRQITGPGSDPGSLETSEPPENSSQVEQVGLQYSNWSVGTPSFNNASSSMYQRPSRAVSSDHSRASSKASAEWTSLDLQQLQQSWGVIAENGNLLESAFTAAHPLKRASVAQPLGVASVATPPRRPNSIVGRCVTTVSGSIATSSDLYAVASVIHDAARITDWNRVLSLCQSNPEFASYAGRDGWTALHHACNRRCPRPEVAEALINAYPAALLQEEEKGWLPLHYACRFKAPKSVVNLLLYLFPESGKAAVAKVDRLGRTPLYYAVRYDAPPGVVGLLLQVDPSAVLEEDQNDESPLALVWDSWAEKLEGKRLINNFLPGGFPEPEDTTAEQRAILLHERLQREPKLRRRWQKVNMLLKAAFGFPVEDSFDDGDDNSLDSTNVTSVQRVWRVVHATAAVKCHLSLFLLACALHPEQAKMFDENDLRRPGDLEVSESSRAHQTALHLAASSNAGGEAGKTVLITLLSLNQEAAEVQDGISGSLPLHRMVENPRKQDWPNHAGILYHFYPRAVQIHDLQGKLPLHRAAAAIRHVERVDNSEDRSVIVQLVRAYPQATLQTDRAGCLPFHYIASHAQVWDDDVESVLGVNRNAVQARAGIEFNNRLPIHMASANSQSKESLLQKLIQLHPRGAAIPDSQGKLPLHLVCENGKEWESGGVRAIYEAFPNAVRQSEMNSRGWLPLHIAAACPHSSADLFKKLIEVYPEAAHEPDSQGCYPLHLACSAGKGWNEGLQILFDANASALSICDKRQRLPFHIAAFLYCKDSSEIEEVTIKALPSVEALNEKQVGFEKAAKLDILYQLLRSDPSTVNVIAGFPV